MKKAAKSGAAKPNVMPVDSVPRTIGVTGLVGPLKGLYRFTTENRDAGWPDVERNMIPLDTVTLTMYRYGVRK